MPTFKGKSKHCFYINGMLLTTLFLAGALTQAQLPNKSSLPKAAVAKNSLDPIFDSTRAFRYLTEQCAFGPRDAGSEGHRRAKDYFTSHFKSLGIPLTLQKFEHTDKASGVKVSLTNFIATIPGKELKRKPVIFCAHWDSRPRADQEPNPALHTRPILGANDGASGVAILLELANVLKQKAPLQTVYLVLFDGEDYGREGHLDEYFLGSRHFAENLPAKNIDYALLLDMVGDRDLKILMEQNSIAQSPVLVGKIWKLAGTLGLSAFQSGPGPTVLDDHMPLQAKGIPAIDIIDFEYPPWHTLGDTPDKCSAFSLGVSGRLVTHLALRGLP
jgi:glutaminyl-peptide cyclotransferase